MNPSTSLLQSFDLDVERRSTCEVRSAPLVFPGFAKPAVLLNACAAKVNARAIRAFERLIPPADLFVSKTLEEAEQHIRTILTGNYPLVIVGGGDGTVSATLRLLLRVGAERQIPRRPPPDLVVLRLGTGNALAHMVGAGEALEDAARVLDGRTGAAIPLRVLEDRDRGEVFSFASLGYDAQVLNDHVELLSQTKNPVGRSALNSIAGYVYTIATRSIPAEIRRRPTRARVFSHGAASLLDPETREEIPLDSNSTLFEGVARAILFGSSPYYGYGMKVLPYARRRTDRFHLRVSTASIPYLVANLPRIWRGTVRSHRFLDFLVEDVRIETTKPLPIQISGDAGGEVGSMRVRLSDKVFRLLEVR